MRTQKSQKSRNRRQSLRRGAIAALIAVTLPALLLILGFSVDLAVTQSARTELRIATDLAAKAAADELSNSGDTDLAVAAGKGVAESNFVAGEPLSLDDTDFAFGRSTRQSNGKWTFVEGDSPFNAVRIAGRRMADAPDGGVALPFGLLYGRPIHETQAFATATFVDVDICLVLDRSSSMKLTIDDPTGLMNTTNSRFCQTPWNDSRWKALEAAVNIFVLRMQSSLADEQVAVVTFGSSYSSCSTSNPATSVDSNLASDLTLVSAAMAVRSNTVWNGMTDIAAGIQTGRGVLTGANARPNAEKIMIVLTDGVYTAADPVPQGAAAANDGITVHTITFSVNANQTDMQNVAEAGGGEHFHAPDEESLNQVFDQLAGRITILTE